MSTFKIIIAAIGLVGVTSCCASAQGIRYSGGPKTGQSFIAPARPMPASQFDARAEMAAPRPMPKGGIALRGL
ncbi:hypothetical protein ACVIJ6_006342 [Bradyrhizobium sp. USDA 4369]